MPASIPVNNTLGALFIGTTLSSVIYGVTWLQVYSYFNRLRSRDQWPLKLFVAFLMLIDTANLVFVICTTYQFGVTNFGDYQSNTFKSWSQPATTLSAIILNFMVQHFYSYRILRLGRCSPHLSTMIIVITHTTLGLGMMYTTNVLKYIHEPGNRSQGLYIAALSCTVLCDVLITFGTVYSLLSDRTQVQRTKVLGLLAIHSLDCGILHLVFSISCLTLLVMYRGTLVYVPCFFIMTQLYPCAVMSILNSQDNLRDTLDGPAGVVATSTQLRVRTATTVLRDVQDPTGVIDNTAVQKSLSVSSDTSFPDSVIVLDGEKYPVPLVAEVVTV
ncbi:hypothetical protein H4582DRAFT_1940728 [Lactarius indigo]|nr:hypothetical protein H4582DRAFT_1940728 [Lactarius indigo]